MTELQLINRTDRDRSRLDLALSIYREKILPEAQNPEKQIMYWIDHGPEDLVDEFRCFAIQQSNKVIGYLQFSYFREENIFFFEYLCLKDQRRNGLVPSGALKAIEDFLAQNYPPYFTIVFEVAHVRDSVQGWRADSKLISYFRRIGFRQIEFEYRYPVLQSYDGELSYPADLMVRVPKNRTEITASELRTVLRCIYFKHYLRWDRPFLEPKRFAFRERLINELYSKEVATIHDKDSFKTKGDENRSGLLRFANRQPRIGSLLKKIFRPKLMRLIVLAVVLLGIEQILGSVLLLTPFVLALAALYCLVEDTQTSRKLFLQIISRMRIVRPRSS